MTHERTVSAPVVGWTAFASFMMILVGLWWVLAGIAGIAKDDVFLTTSKYVFKFSTSAWGWIHVVLGILVFLAGMAVFRGAVWGRTVGVIMALLSCLIGFAWLPAYPFWGIVLIAASVFVIWALTVHGHEIAEDYSGG